MGQVIDMDKGGTFMKHTDINLEEADFIFAAIFLLANRMQIIGDKIDSSVSTKQWFVLAAVTRFIDTPPNIGDVAKLLGTSRQNIKKIANILERKGYMQLRKDPSDLRNIQLFLTDSCYDYFKSREQQENEYIKGIFFGIDDEMLKSLANGMSKLIENVDGMMEGNF
jgi:DNA-binding MarR family transcriptional regulator